MIISSIYQGLLYGILGLGIYMTFRIFGIFPDLTTEGSFPLGGAVAVTLMNFGWNPFSNLGCRFGRLWCWTCDWSPLY